jgi:hypothetical protein
VRRLLAAIGAVIASLALPSAAAACSPPFERPTIEALGPGQVVVVGTIGEPVAGGRLFHVERTFNGASITPIVIAFKEGEPVGDCSYPVHAGERLIIAPFMEDGGRLSADLGTLQADPASEDGKRYLAEAEALFGPGSLPDEAEPEQEGVPSAMVVVLALGALVAVTLAVAVRRARSG